MRPEKILSHGAMYLYFVLRLKFSRPTFFLQIPSLPQHLIVLIACCRRRVLRADARRSGFRRAPAVAFFFFFSPTVLGVDVGVGVGVLLSLYSYYGEP